MVIESRELGKEYAKEFINVVSMGAILIKDPNKKLRNNFVIYPGIIGCCIAGIGLMWLMNFLSHNKIFEIIMAGLLIGAFMISLFYIQSLLSLRKSLKKKRDVTYTFDVGGIEYDDHESDKTMTAWDSYTCMLIMEHGLYFLPNEQTGVLIGISREYEQQIKDFIIDNEIELQFVEQ